MKNRIKFVSYISSFMIFLSLTLLNSNLFSQQLDEEDVGCLTCSMKYIFLNLGYAGVTGLSAGPGFKYSFNDIPFGISAGINLSGFSKQREPYSSDYRTFLAENKYDPATKLRYTTLIVTGDVGLYYDFDRMSIYGSIGYYMQNDSIRALSLNPNDNFYYVVIKNPTETISGLCFGFGFQYFLKDNFGLGIGYHTKNGIHLQGGYYFH